MSYTTYIPCPRLQPYIAHFAVSEQEEEQEYKVLPGTALVMGFQYKGTLAHVVPSGAIALAPSGVSGITPSYRIFRNARNTGTILVYFKEAGAAPFFREPLHELFDESLSLDHFMLRSTILLLEEQLCAAGTDAQRIQLVEQFLLDRLNPASPDPLVLAALSVIHQYKGQIRIADLARQLLTSQSPLEKRFRKVVGTTPKKFATLVQWQHAVKSYVPGTALTALSYEAGFYDQAHFIKVFKTFSGETPEEFFRQR